MKHRELISGWIAFAGGGVAAVAGGHSDSWDRAVLYMMIGIVLAGFGHWLLAIRPERQGKTTTPLDPRLRELSEAVGMTDENFVAWYQPIAEQQSESMIRFTTTVLKHRRGRILGVGHGQEAARRNRDRWTYVVFLAAIAQVSGSQQNREKGLKTLLLGIPESAREWLSRESNAMESLTQAVLGQERSNAIWRLVDDATEKDERTAESFATGSETPGANREPKKEMVEATRAMITPDLPGLQQREKRQGFNSGLTDQPGST